METHESQHRRNIPVLCTRFADGSTARMRMTHKNSLNQPGRHRAGAGFARHMKHVQHWSYADKNSLAVFHGWALSGDFW
jgi:hypothetical protein